MIKLIKKLNALLILSAILAGIVFCMCGFSVSVPKGVRVDGVEVGGMSRTAALKYLRTQTEQFLAKKKLKIVGQNCGYEFTYPEINYKDDLYFVIRNAQKGGEYTSSKSYYLCGLNTIARDICLNERIFKTEPYFDFCAEGAPFVYHEGNDGREADPARLKNDILNSLKGGFEQVNVTYRTVKRQTTVQNLREQTTLLGEFTTYFDPSNLNRANNIKLAASLVNGSVIQSKKALSFNDTVGARVIERGFLPAKIIENGEYTEGVGGGVCQVSTTLYNAALLSGLAIAEYHPHSLAVGYVAPSRDAMVSGSACDLKINNPYPYPVYIRAKANDGSVNFKIYGKSDGAKYYLESLVTGTLPPPEEECATPEEEREGKSGVVSEGYLVTERNGYKKRVKLRSDKYLPTKKLVFRDASVPPEAPQEGQNTEIFKKQTTIS